MFKKLLVGISIMLFASFLFIQNVSFGKIKKGVTTSEFQECDIIFQSSKSRQCEAVKLATHSDISHCGILLKQEGKWMVLEAVEPVQIISLKEFISRGTGAHYTIKRTKKELRPNASQIAQMKKMGQKWIGRHYDIYFNWNDNEIYCSELVWKIYKDAAKLELCKPKKLKDFDLKAPLVQEMMKERYGNNIPFNESVVAPSDIFNSEKLELVVSE